jgi:hypothetical protein
MGNDDNKKQLKRGSKSREVLQSKVRLVNRFSLIALTLTSVVALWLVSPSRTMLLTLLAESSSPDVALAFLYALDKSVQDDEEIKYLMFKNYLILNNLVKAEALILPLLQDINGKKNWKAFEKYLSLLLVEYWAATTKQEKDKKLSEISALFNKIGYIPIPHVARVFADYALAMGFVEKAYQYLLPFSDNQEITNHQELRNLALQFSAYQAALKHQRIIFSKQQTLEQLKRLLNLFNNANKKIEAFQFVKQYSENLEDDFRRKNLIASSEFIVLSIEQSLSQGDYDFASLQIKKIIKILFKESFLSRIIDASLAQNRLDLATIASVRKVSLYPTQANIVQAHDIAIWHGNIFRALELSHLRIANNPSELNIRQAIKESIALGDYSSQATYYQRLEKNQFLKVTEFDDYIKLIELNDGSRSAINVVKSLLGTTVFSNKQDVIIKKLMLHKARLHSYFSENDVLDGIWLQLLELEDKGAIQKISRDEAELFINARIDTNQPEAALDISLKNANWLEGDLNYLQVIFSLAWQIGNKSIAITTLDELMTRTDYDSSNALNGYRYIQLHQPFSVTDIPRLLELSKLWDNERLLLIAIDLAYNNKDYPLLDRLLSKMMKEPGNINDERLLFYAALSAIKQGKSDRVKILFARILKNIPKDSSVINSYLWWLIEKNEIELLEDVYNRYKFELKDRVDFWLVFSSASQKLGRYSEAEHWLRKLLIEESDVSINNILYYAQLMEVKGNNDIAFRLRQYVVNNLSQELFDLEPQHYSFISILKIFSGERFALPLLEQQVVTNPDLRGTIDLFSYYLQRQNYQHLFLLNDKKYLGHFKLPDWQKLSIALLEKDKQTIESLVKNSLQLPIVQKNYAMQKLGGSANERWTDAWKHGENWLGVVNNERVEKELRQVYIGQHPKKSHGFQIDYTSFAFWDIERVSFRSYQPIQNGWWDATLLQQYADSPLLISSSIIENETRGLFDINFKIDWFTPFLQQAQPELLSIKVDLASGIGSVRSGALIGLSLNIDDRLESYYDLGINQAFEVSQFATLAAQSDRFSFGLNYFPTNRESVSFRLNLNDVTTRFGDEVATGWDYSLRVSEKLFVSDPGWNLYFDFVQQEYNYKKAPLTKINEFYSLNNRIEPIDFVNKKYARFAVGQRVFQGNPGEPGTVKGSPRYWIDTSVGFNVLNKQKDFSLSSGLGWQLFGDDELSIKLDWQSSDTNGDESLKFSIGYYYNL